MKAHKYKEPKIYKNIKLKSESKTSNLKINKNVKENIKIDSRRAKKDM